MCTMQHLTLENQNDWLLILLVTPVLDKLAYPLRENACNMHQGIYAMKYISYLEVAPS